MNVISNTLISGLVFLTGISLANCNSNTNNSMSMAEETPKEAQDIAGDPSTQDTATFGSGCFWCTEAIFQSLEGVYTVESGYTNGQVKNPSYKEVCTGRTGHAEVARITYDSKTISFKELLEVFWQTHDPTTLNRQGADVGTQYRSGVYWHNEEQRKIAEEYKKKLDESGAFDNPIVTEIVKIDNYYPAEDYHQNYFNENGDQPYCSYVIRPKMEKFKKAFSDKLK